jgi:putative selenate reductase
MRLGDPGNDGRRKVVAIENEFETIEVDTVISAIGENVDMDFLEKNEILVDDHNRAKVSLDTNETMIENVYIGGDALRGPSTVVESIADGQKAADAIIRKEGLDVAKAAGLNAMFDQGRRISDLLQARGNVTPTASGAEGEFISAKEASRCLGCNFICDKCVDVCPNRANVAIPTAVSDDGFRNIAQILHIDALCNECGNCETFCPYSVGSPYKSKTTLFWSEKELLESSNDGFYVEAEKKAQSHFTAAVRFNNEVGTIVCDSKGALLHGTLQISDGRMEFNNFTRLIANIVFQHSYLLPSPGQ